ncbi:hypothetical protein GCM10011579_086400 [Streptomyces albiflavescens]|uniref:Uncharacterized protein n=1 Tax=Streptomyces albiflavescens TaxID=1623582 RepID=A0A918DA79_9ACTN|nr:hypothetical protein GCM10011579_086400 [Streptomyces albiflavescens]
MTGFADAAAVAGTTPSTRAATAPSAINLGLGTGMSGKEGLRGNQERELTWIMEASSASGNGFPLARLRHGTTALPPGRRRDMALAACVHKDQCGTSGASSRTTTRPRDSGFRAGVTR